MVGEAYCEEVLVHTKAISFALKPTLWSKRLWIRTKDMAIKTRNPTINTYNSLIVKSSQRIVELQYVPYES